MSARGLAALCAAVTLAGCASVARGTSEQVQFDSEPAGATMRSIVDYPCGGPCPVHDQNMGSSAPFAGDDVRTPVVSGPACVTPCMAQVLRNQDLIATFEKPGYQPQTVNLKSHVSGGGAAGVAGNVLLGGAVGLVVDAGTGAGLDHYPNPLKVLLQPISPPPNSAKPRKRSVPPDTPGGAAR